jgi:hypothetical protein
MLPAYPLVFGSNTADGATLTNSTVAANIMPASGLASIPGGTLQVGSMLKITMRGRISTVVTTPGTLTFDVRFGSVIVSAFGAAALNTTAQTNAQWMLEILAQIRSVGSGTAATALCTAGFISRAVIGSPGAAAGGAGELLLPETAPAVGTGFDSTAAFAVNVFAAWSVANAANSITVHQSLVELKV